ncbi:hypothetical protein NI385_26250 (plasmid) [Vibrio parahaemolyticus]|nr:hypothetical protein NI385_26250 [Vibrio parahaemolyticus]
MKTKRKAEDFKVGQKVSWSSQARGAVTKKSGVVVAIKPVGIASSAYAKANFPNHAKMFDGNLDSRKVTLLVEVPNGNAKPKLYLPYPSTLKDED